MRLYRKLLIIFSTVAWQSAAHAQVQKISQIFDSTTCKTCKIESRAIVDLSSALDALKSEGSFPTGVKIDSKNRYWVLGAGQPRIFAADGSPLALRASVEVQNIRAPTEVISIPGDSTLLLDPKNGKALLFDSSLRFVRSFEFDLRATSGISIRWPSRVVLNGMMSSADGAGFPLHEVSFIGKKATVERSFSADDATLLVDGGINMQPYISIDPRSGFWVADVSKYSLTKWPTPSGYSESLVRIADWFKPSSVTSIGGPNMAPLPRIVAAVADSNRLLWVYVHVPNPIWRSAWPPPVPGLSEVAITSGMIPKLFTTVIEIIDVRKRTVLTRLPLDGVAVTGLLGNRVAIMTVDAGIPKLRVLQLSLLGNSQ